MTVVERRDEPSFKCRSGIDSFDTFLLIGFQAHSFCRTYHLCRPGFGLARVLR
jgi:hypothetical protein